MEITSVKYIGITIISVFLYYILPHKYRLYFITILSIGFIATYDYFLSGYIILFALVNFILARNIPSSKHKKSLFRLGIAFNILQIVFFKYSSFAIDPLLSIIRSDFRFSDSTILIPIGMSYFTLQAIGYLINVKMGWEKPERRFINFLVYIIYFPKFLSGPIERSNHFLPQINKCHIFNKSMVAEGMRIALFGFFKKIVIANQLAPFVLTTFNNIESVNGYALLLVFFVLPIYLYFDFSGYTDIAIGFSKAFGIDLLPNFNRPFFAENVTVFWKRFHISLSSWFNDYVFRQLSFKYRKWGIFASIFAVFATWLLFGIWHGAGWNFMVLGLLQALVIIYEFFTKKIRVKLFSILPDYLGLWIGRFFTYTFYGVSLVIFFSSDLDKAMQFLERMINLNEPIPPFQVSTIPISLILGISLFLILELLQNDFNSNKLVSYWKSDKKWNVIFRWSIYSLAITVMFVAYNKINQFVYVNF